MNFSFLKKTILFLTVGLTLQSCFTMRTSDKKTYKTFKKKNIPVTIKKHHLQSVDYKVRVVNSAFDTPKDIALFIVHGAPGSSKSYYKYLQDSLLLSKANLYSIDRPGYGYSNFGKTEVSITKQAKVVSEIINKLPEKKVIVLGHSFGGPIAAYASLYSSKIKSVMMLAPALDPDNEKFLKIAYFGKWKLTKWLTPGALATAADEKFAHIEELTKIKGDWQNITTPMMHIHGSKDAIVPYENLNFSKKVFDNQIL